MNRRLTTIVSADMVGYSRLMAADEEGTLTRLQAVRAQLIDPEIAAAGGRVIKTMGDGLLAEFPSPVSAVRTMIALQDAISGYEPDHPEASRMLFRIGLNLGDVIVDGDDIMGDGVNIAVRLEGLAQPGGIVISSSLHEQIKGKVDCRFSDMGPQRVKNIPEPINAFAAELDGVTEVTKEKKQTPGNTGMDAAVALAKVIGGYFSVGRSPELLADLPAVTRAPGAGSLIVLPFQDYSSDQSLDYFADGLTEDLITDLARWKEFRIIARNTSMTYRNVPVDVCEIARKQNTRYVLEGSVRRIGDEMRITAQLIDGDDGGHVWAERFEETSSDVLALQDNVIAKIVQTLIGNHGVVREDEYARTWSKAAADLDEYDYALRGHALFYQFNPDSMASAVALWKEGLEKYPDSGLMKIKLGWGYQMSTQLRFAQNRQSYQDTLEIAEAGLADPSLPPMGHRFGLWLLANVNSYLGNVEATVSAVNEIARSYPFDAEGLLLSVGDLARVGELDLAEQWLNRASGLDNELALSSHGSVGFLRYIQGDYQGAIESLKSTLFNPTSALLLAACYVELERIEEARALMAKAATRFSIHGPADYPSDFRYLPEVSDRLSAQLARLGQAAPG